METGLQKTLKLLKKYEGFRDSVYLDGNGISTIGYGFTDPELIKKGKITRKEADDILKKRIATEYKSLQDTLPNFDKLTDDSKAALISYKFNYPAGFKDTTRFMKHWNAGEYAKAIKEVDAGMNDKKNPGLRTRRLEEQAMLSADPFLTGPRIEYDDWGKKMVFPKEWEPEWNLYTPPKTIYPLNNDAPESISSWSGAGSPNAGRVKTDFRDLYKPEEYQGVLDQGITVKPSRPPFKLSLSLPSLDSLMLINSPLRLMEQYFADALNIPNLFLQPSLYPRFKNGKLPRFEDGYKYSWNSDTRSWDRYTGDAMGQVFNNLFSDYYLI